MTKRTRRNHSPAFKAKVALAAIKRGRTLPIWPSSLMFILTRLQIGRRNFWRACHRCCARDVTP